MIIRGTLLRPDRGSVEIRTRTAPIITTFGNNQCQWVVLSVGRNRPGEDHDKISTDRSSGGLVAQWSYVCHGSKWTTHWERISTSGVEPQSLWLLRLPSSLLSSPLRLLSSSLLSSSLPSLLLELVRRVGLSACCQRSEGVRECCAGELARLSKRLARRSIPHEMVGRLAFAVVLPKTS